MDDFDLTWMQLIAEVRRLEKLSSLKEGDFLEMKRHLSALRLVQSFDWMHWSGPSLNDVDMQQLDIDDCVRYITRHVRGERFYENSLAPWIKGGVFGDLCEVARQKARGQKAPLLPKAQ